MKAVIGELTYHAPVNTSITIIGSGSPQLINHFKRMTGCPYSVYSDVDGKLFKLFKLPKTINWGYSAQRPHYAGELEVFEWAKEQRAQKKDVKQLCEEGLLYPTDTWARGGSLFQVGGEFLFGEGKCVWGHRMQHFLDHTEPEEVARVVGL